MESAIVLRLPERFRSQQAEVLLPRVRDAVLLPLADRWLLDPAHGGDRRRAAQGFDHPARQLNPIFVHAPKYRRSESRVNRGSG